MPAVLLCVCLSSVSVKINMHRYSYIQYMCTNMCQSVCVCVFAGDKWKATDWIFILVSISVCLFRDSGWNDPVMMSQLCHTVYPGDQGGRVWLSANHRGSLLHNWQSAPVVSFSLWNDGFLFQTFYIKCCGVRFSIHTDKPPTFFISPQVGAPAPFSFPPAFPVETLLLPDYQSWDVGVFLWQLPWR